MFGIEKAIEEVIVFGLKQPLIITAIATGLFGFFYYLGWIINANNWQYLNTRKEGQLYRGFMFLSSTFFLPATVFIGVIYLLNWEKSLIEHICQIHILWYFIGLISILIIFNRIDKMIQNEIRKFEIKPIIKYSLVQGGGLNYIFIFLNFSILVYLNSYYDRLLLAFVLLWLDVLILTKWARLSSLYNQAAEAIIHLKNNDLLEVRLIEFIENGKFLKVQKKDKRNVDVLMLPISTIEKINLLTNKQHGLPEVKIPKNKKEDGDLPEQQT